MTSETIVVLSGTCSQGLASQWADVVHGEIQKETAEHAAAAQQEEAEHVAAK